MARSRTVHTRQCKECGQTFNLERLPHIVHGKRIGWRPSRRKYCAECYQKKNWYSTRPKPPGRPKGSGVKPKLPNTTCSQCSNRFYKTNAWKRKSKHHFCSPRCLHAWRSETMKGKRQPQLDANPPTPEQRRRAARRGADNPAWKGGVTYRRSKGNYGTVRYVRCPPEFVEMARKDGYVMEHRLVMAHHINRPLKRVEVVHHINHDTLDNRIENLMLFPDNRAHKLYESSHSHQPP